MENAGSRLKMRAGDPGSAKARHPRRRRGDGIKRSRKFGYGVSRKEVARQKISWGGKSAPYLREQHLHEKGHIFIEIL